jgi:hypothetical protein
MIEATPALQARIYQLIRRDQELLSKRYSRAADGSADDQLRARAVTQAVTSAIRVAMGVGPSTAGRRWPTRRLSICAAWRPRHHGRLTKPRNGHPSPPFPGIPRE